MKTLTTIIIVLLTFTACGLDQAQLTAESVRTASESVPNAAAAPTPHEDNEPRTQATLGGATGVSVAECGIRQSNTTQDGVIYVRATIDDPALTGALKFLFCDGIASSMRRSAESAHYWASTPPRLSRPTMFTNRTLCETAGFTWRGTCYDPNPTTTTTIPPPVVELVAYETTGDACVDYDYGGFTLEMSIGFTRGATLEDRFEFMESCSQWSAEAVKNFDDYGHDEFKHQLRIIADQLPAICAEDLMELQACP